MKTPNDEKAESGRWVIAKQRRRKVKCPPPRAYVSLNRRGEIVMNAEAFGKIKEPANVTLLYDAEQRRIGVKRPIESDENFFRVRRYGRGRRMRIVRAGRMLKQFDITIERTLIFKNAEYDVLNNEPMLILNLDGARPRAQKA